MTEDEKRKKRDEIQTEIAQSLFNIGRKEAFVRESQRQIEALHERVEALTMQVEALNASATEG